MTIETKEYILKSNPYGEPVIVPEEFAKDARKIVDETIDTDNVQDLKDKMQKYNKSNHYSVFTEALRLRSYLVKGQWCGAPEFLRTEDALYLKFCLYNMYDLVKESNKVEYNEEEHNGLLNMIIPIMNTLRSLEDVEDGRKN